MADTFPDLDFSNPQQDTLDGMSNPLFPGVNFSENIDPQIEDALAVDFPSEEVQEVPAPEALTTSSPQLEAPVSSAPDPSHGLCSEQPQFINPQQLSLAPQSTYADINFLDINNLGMGWSNNQQQQQQQPLDKLLTTDPAFIPHPLNNQGHPQYFPMGTQLQGQPPVYQQQLPAQMIGQQLFQDPMITQMNAQSRIYGPPIMRMPMNSQPMIHQQPGGYQLNHQPAMYQQPPNPVYQAPWPPRRQRANLPVPRRVPRRGTRPAPEGGQAVIDSRNPSSVPEPIDRSLHSQQPPSAGTVTTSPPLKRPAKNHHGVPLLNDKIPRKTHRKLANEEVEPERYYGPSPPKPADWGPRDEKGRHLFTYTEKGELVAGLFLDPHQMRQYLLGPTLDEDFEPPRRLPGVKSSKRKFRQGLTLWIGWPAAMANWRYPRGGESTKCRFQNCQYANTIAVGDPWVILDERRNVDGEMIDPFHNAGYVHLYCLEHHFDLIDLWHLIDIRPDCRVFKRESHPYFSLEHKLTGIDVELRTWWIATYEAWWHLKSHGRKRIRDHETSLAQCLINFKLEHEPKALARNREKRKGIDMAKHRGNPELKRKLRAYQKYGLLDENGFPVADAAARLDEIENPGQSQSQSRRKGSPNSRLVSPPHPFPVQNNGQQFLPPPYVQQMEPAYAAELIYPPTNFVHPNQHGYALQAPNMPFEMERGQKRGYGETVATDATTSPPKRQQLGGIASPPVPHNIPAATAVPAGGADMHGYNTAPAIGSSADFPIEIDLDLGVDIQTIAQGLDLEPQSGVSVSGVQPEAAGENGEEAVGDANEQHREVSPPASLPPAHDVSQGQQQQGEELGGEPADPLPASPPQKAAESDDNDSLFGNPEDYDGQPDETPSNLSASPKEGGFALPPLLPPFEAEAFPPS